MLKRMVEKMHIASLCGFNVELQIIKIDSEEPRFLIINNLHGDELSGFYILEKFLKGLSKIQGTLAVITSANSLGLAHKNRLLPFDFVDLNRNYPPAYKERGINVVLKEKLIEIGLNYDLILDVHNFTRPSLSAGVAIEQNNKISEKTMRDCLQVLGMDIVIGINAKIKEEKRTSSSLTAYLASQGKLAFGVEYPPSSQLDNKQIKRYTTGLNNLLTVVGLNSKMDFIQSNFIFPSIFQRQQIISRTTGLFVPNKRLRTEIKSGDVLGYLINIENLQREPLISPYDGMLTEMSDRRLCLFGEKVATVGKPVKNFVYEN